MSLLIKALQKAEQEKTAEDKTSASDAGLSLELAPRQTAADTNPNTATGLSRAPVSPVQNQKQVGQQAAATMFAAKTAPTNNAGLSKSAIYAGASLLLLLLLGGGFYVYLNTLTQPELVMPKPLAAISSPATSAPITEAQVSGDVTSTNATDMAPTDIEEASSVTGTSEAPIKGTDNSSEAIAKNADESEDIRSERSIVTAAAPRQNSVKRSQQLAFGEPIEPSEDTAVKVTRNKPATGINPALMSAYEAFNAGDDATAQRYYRQVLQNDVRNVDALLGMAAIASRQGRNTDALGWYGKVLEVEPRNSVAQAAMVSVLAQADPVGSESRIKNLLAQQPETAHLHAALGNLYAEQNQWPSAQQAYFQAHHFDASNAEYAFNLAVSLDHLGKSALALQYYKTTLELLAKSSASNIDRAQIESRITQLE